ncbi:MAG: hypothetical protein ACKOQY_09930 [Bacteroidota bacterium]
MRDFTLNKYQKLIRSILESGYQISTFEDFIRTNPAGPVVILRHDVDDRPYQSLLKARFEHSIGVKSTYYFRIVPESNHPEIIRETAELGHEIGYHYEDLSLANGEPDKAIELFVRNLHYFRKYYPVDTICMHGSPASVWDNRLIWQSFKYKDYGISAEPYFDIDFNTTLYLTDTGRTWNGSAVSVRDKVKSPLLKQHSVRTTEQLIKRFKERSLPQRIMITTHPQRWDNQLLPWLRELILQNIKNGIKKYLYISPPMTD